MKRFLLHHQLLAIFVLLAIAAIAAEIVLQRRPLPAYAADLILLQGADIDVHMPSNDLRLLYTLRPNIDIEFKPRGKPPRRVTTNSLGLRDPERSLTKPDNVYRIVIFGSSTTYGAEVAGDETMPACLERILNERYPEGPSFEVWNAGTSAYTPMQEAALAERLIERGLEADVLLFQINIDGPRAFLYGHIDPSAFARDPSLLAEHFLLPDWLSLKATAWVVAHSRLALLLLAHVNRMAGAEKRELGFEKIHEAHHANAMTAFRERYGDHFRLAALNVPCLKPDDNHEVRRSAGPAGIPTWCVQVEDGDPELMLLHPPAWVYRIWAQTLADLLAQHKFLPNDSQEN